MPQGIPGGSNPFPWLAQWKEGVCEGVGVAPPRFRAMSDSTLGWFRVTLGSFSEALRALRVTLGSFRVALGSFRVTLGVV